jgi:integrase
MLGDGDVNEAVATLAASGRKRSTIRKSVKYLAAVLDDAGIEQNPARDSRVRLPHEQAPDKSVPLADHVEAVFMALASAYRLPFLWLDWSGARLASVETLRVGDYDEPGRRVWLRALCKATGIPTFTPHRLRDRRVSVLHEAGWSAARIAEFVGHEDLTTTIDVYTHVMGDCPEADYAELLAA